MANWLEAEEHKKSLLLQREEAVHKHLKTFYDLCTRVNGVKPGALSIHRLKVVGQRSLPISKIESDGDGGSMGARGKRGISVSCPNPDETFIDLVIHEHHHHIDRVCGDISSDREKVVVRKTCALQELSDWREDQILNAIQWMMLESEAVKDSIPGTEIVTEGAIAEAKAKRLEIREGIQRSAGKKQEADGYFLETLKGVIEAKKPLEFWMGLAKLPVAAMKSIVTSPRGIRRRFRGNKQTPCKGMKGSDWCFHNRSLIELPGPGQ